MKVTEVNRLGDFLALREEWNNVLERSSHSIFSTWEWLTIWWKHFGNEKKLVILLAEDKGHILGIAPLMYSVHKMFGLRLGKIEFIGSPQSDYNDFITSEKSEECLKLFVDYLYDLPEKWDFIDLVDIPENAKSLDLLSKISRKFGLIHECPHILLPKSYDGFLMGLKRNQRKNIYSTTRRMEATFKVEFLDHSGVDSYDEGMQLLIELHQKRWQSRGFGGSFAEQESRNFCLDIAKSFSQKKWLNLFVLALSGEPAAALFGFKYRSKCYEYVSGLEPKYFKYSVGNLLRAYVINKLIQEGIVELDFLRGAEEYKTRWNATSRWNRQAVLAKKGILNNFRNWLYDEYWHQGSRVKYLLKNPRVLRRTRSSNQ